MKTNNNGFTLAEILGVIVVIGLLLVLIAPTILNRLSSSSDDTNETMNQFIYDSTLIHINENVQKYPPGKSSKYCVPIKDLVESGELTSPVEDITTGKNIEDKVVLVQKLSENNIDYKIMTQEECDKELDNALIVTLQSCPTGYTKSDKDPKKCSKTTVLSANNIATKVYNCPSGYTKRGSGSSTSCYKRTTTSTSRLSKKNYSCPSGYTKSGSGSSTKCSKKSTTTTSPTQTTTKSCNGGCSLSGNQCSCRHSMQLYYKIYCSDPEGSKQKWRSYVNGYLSQGYRCECNVLALTSQGYSGSGNECYRKQDKCGSYTGAYYDAGTFCHRSWTESPRTSTGYTCPSGYKKSGSGSSMKCTKSTTVYANPTTSTTYYCPSGYTSSGYGSSMRCTKSTTVYANPTTSYSYSCPSGYTSSGYGSSMKCNKTVIDTVDVIETIQYNCPPGYVLNNKKCVKG